jgi:hypothetical protein
VIGGYVTAFLVASGTVALYDRRFTPADNQAMGGMIAGGEMMLGFGVFVLASLVPTWMALWFVRRHRGTWSVFTVACIVFAALGLAAVLSAYPLRGPVPRASWLVLVDLFGVMHMLGSPIWLACFALFALLAPAPHLRRRMLLAVAIEIVIGGLGLVHFLSGMPSI